MACPACGAPTETAQKFCGACGATLSGTSACRAEPSPASYTPQHLAEKILASKSAVEGERKQVTVLFADVKGSMELADGLGAEDSTSSCSASRRSWPRASIASRAR